LSQQQNSISATVVGGRMELLFHSQDFICWTWAIAISLLVNHLYL